jgi:hypothetical protein
MARNLPEDHKVVGCISEAFLDAWIRCSSVE